MQYLTFATNALRGDPGVVCDEPQPGAQVVDCKGAWLSPGWCDLHVHIWHGGTDISVRASGVIVGSWGITPAKIAKRVAEMAGLPMMVHVGEPPPLLDVVFDILSPGDIVTQCFNGKQGGSIRDTAALFAQALRSRLLIFRSRLRPVADRSACCAMSALH